VQRQIGLLQKGCDVLAVHRAQGATDAGAAVDVLAVDTCRGWRSVRDALADLDHAALVGRAGA
jgi:hypothetical protein